MKEFLNAISTEKKPQCWMDKYSVYVLLKQEELPKTDDEPIMYRSDYAQYSKDEYIKVMADKNLELTQENEGLKEQVAVIEDVLCEMDTGGTV